MKNFVEKYSGKITIIGSGWKSLFSSQVACVGEIFDDRLFTYYQGALCCLGFLRENITDFGQGDVITTRSYNVPILAELFYTLVIIMLIIFT